MMYQVLLAALAASPLVAAHGKIAVVQGDAGGNGTALGIQGGVVPGPGRNSVTEVDTTVFGSTNIATNGLGKTTGNGRNTVSMVANAMAQSGNTLPQVSANGGSVSGTFHVVTTDGAGPVKAMVDSTGTGAFANGAVAEVATQVPGRGGNISPSGKVPGQANRRWLLSRSLMKRAANVNKDYPVKVNIPAGTTCTGTMGGQQNVCLLKIANSNPAGPFGGVIAFQIAGNNAAAPAASGTGAAPAAAATGAAAGTDATGATTGATGATGANAATGKAAKGAAKGAAAKGQAAKGQAAQAAADDE
ncbi:hypothetical protein K461DRAFT_280932 [Myriangium duriaei CBS 260.36]|uniref:Cell surface protein n=1 Tax=Myriangium duriaei CBS 260.36 TaxID=1168546 RepID=A0A9P4IWG1_9PEZI|nr:hypothetical protein K461DRAFT_280932 [Myriangium duriaei CBS 260.36]